MAHKSTCKPILLIILAASLALSGCLSNAADPLPLQPYTDPTGRFTFAIPEGWSSTVSADKSQLSLTPPRFTDSPEQARVLVFTAPTFTQDPNDHVAAASALLDPWLQAHIDEGFEVLNRGETKVDKRPAVIIDYAKPYEGSYLSGRLVIVAMPYYALAFIGMAERETWDAFLPTFKQMLIQFQLISAYGTSPTP